MDLLVDSSAVPGARRVSRVLLVGLLELPVLPLLVVKVGRDAGRLLPAVVPGVR